jgi:hypothetical protein
MCTPYNRFTANKQIKHKMHKQRVFYIDSDRGDGKLYGEVAVNNSFGTPTTAQCWECTDGFDREFLLFGTVNEVVNTHGIKACKKCKKTFG